MRADVYRPNPDTPHDQASSTGTADIKALTKPANAQGVFLTVETTGCYLTVDGTDPSSSNGLFLATGVVHFMPLALDSDLKFASSAAAASKLNALWVN